jgi:hypothetical protein
LITVCTGFAGFVCRVCSDGGNYEVFIRTGLYETDGIEYACEFNTIIKPTQKWNKSPNKFKTIRLDLENFIHLCNEIDEPNYQRFCLHSTI